MSARVVEHTTTYPSRQKQITRLSKGLNKFFSIQQPQPFRLLVVRQHLRPQLLQLPVSPYDIFLFLGLQLAQLRMGQTPWWLCDTCFRLRRCPFFEKGRRGVCVVSGLTGAAFFGPFLPRVDD